MVGVDDTVVVLAVVLVVWLVVVTALVLSIVLSCNDEVPLRTRRRRRCPSSSSPSSTSSSSSSSSDSEAPTPRPPRPSPSPGTSPGPPPALANVFGYSYTDPTATGILSSAAPTAPVIVTPDITGLEPLTIAVPGPNSHVPFSPLSIAATFTYDYRYVVSLSQAAASSPFDPRAPVGWINVIDPTTDTVVSTTPIANGLALPSAMVFSVVSTNTALSSILVAVNYGTVGGFSVQQFDMTSAGFYSASFNASQPNTLVTDIRTSPNGLQVLYTLSNPALNNVYIWDLSAFPVSLPTYAIAQTTTELTLRYSTFATNIAISGAWTQDSSQVLISTGEGNVPDTVILYRVPLVTGPLTFVGSAKSVIPQSPPSTPLKIIVGGTIPTYVVGRTGTSSFDFGTLASLALSQDSSVGFLPGDDGTGIQDFVVAPNGVESAALYNSGRTVAIQSAGLNIALPVTPGSRIAFSRDSNWLFVGVGGATSPVGLVMAINATASAPVVILSPTNPQTYFLTGTSSADLNGQPEYTNP